MKKELEESISCMTLSTTSLGYSNRKTKNLSMSIIQKDTCQEEDLMQVTNSTIIKASADYGLFFGSFV